MSKVIPQIEPLFGEEERQAVYDYMGTGAWLTEHVKTRELEEVIANYIGIKHCIMFPNGTMALYAALHAMHVGPGSKVIVPDFTMVASVDAIRMLGAEPVLVDVDWNLCLDLDNVERILRNRGVYGGHHGMDTIMVVDINGRTPDIGRLEFLAQTYGCRVIEDACQAFGSASAVRMQKCGRFGDIGAFSFSPHKIISMGQGGCLVTDSDYYMVMLRRFKNFGRWSSGGDDFDVFGTNLKFTDLQAAIGLEQMKKIDTRVLRKREMYMRYWEQLHALEKLSFIETDLIVGCENAMTPWYVDALVLSQLRKTLVDHLKSLGIGTRPFYPAIHTLPGPWSNGDEGFPVSTAVSQSGLWLPSSLSLTDDDIDNVCEAIISFYQGGKL